MDCRLLCVNEKRYTEVGRLRAWGVDDNGLVHFELDGAVSELSIAADGSVRLRAERGSELPPDPDAAIGRDPWRPAQVGANDDDGLIVVTTVQRGVRVEVGRDPFAVRARDRTGAVFAELGGLAFAFQSRGKIGRLTCSKASRALSEVVTPVPSQAMVALASGAKPAR